MKVEVLSVKDRKILLKYRKIVAGMDLETKKIAQELKRKNLTARDIKGLEKRMGKLRKMHVVAKEKILDIVDKIEIRKVEYGMH